MSSQLTVFEGQRILCFYFEKGCDRGAIPSIAKLHNAPVNTRPRDGELSGSRLFRKRGKELREAARDGFATRSHCADGRRNQRPGPRRLTHNHSLEWTGTTMFL